MKKSKPTGFALEVTLYFKTFGQLMKFLREQHKMTQGALADKLGIKQPSVARLENSKSENWPSHTMMKKVSKLFNYKLTPPYFLCKKCDKKFPSECKCK